MGKKERFVKLQGATMAHYGDIDFYDMNQIEYAKQHSFFTCINVEPNYVCYVCSFHANNNI